MALCAIIWRTALSLYRPKPSPFPVGAVVVLPNPKSPPASPLPLLLVSLGAGAKAEDGGTVEEEAEEKKLAAPEGADGLEASSDSYSGLSLVPTMQK